MLRPCQAEPFLSKLQVLRNGIALLWTLLLRGWTHCIISCPGAHQIEMTRTQIYSVIQLWRSPVEVVQSKRWRLSYQGAEKKTVLSRYRFAWNRKVPSVHTAGIRVGHRTHPSPKPVKVRPRFCKRKSHLKKLLKTNLGIWGASEAHVSVKSLTHGWAVEVLKSLQSNEYGIVLVKMEGKSSCHLFFRKEIQERNL